MKYPDITMGRVEAVWNKLGGEEGVARFLADTVEIVLKKLFTIINKISHRGASGKPTAECFTGSIWKYRDSNLDAWLPKSQPKCPASPIAVVKPEKPWTFIEFAQAVTGLATTDLKELGTEIIRLCLVLTLEQAQDLAERTEAGEATDLKTDGYANFFFVETKDKDVPVAVGDVRRHDVRHWNACVCRLGYDRRWDVDDRFLLCNADSSKL